MSAALETVSWDVGLPIRCDGIRHIFPGADGEEVVALDYVDLAIEAGESVALFGPSGSGKSTLLTLMAGLLRPTAGDLFVGEQNLGALSERQLTFLRSRHIGVVLQNPGRNLLAYGTAEDNIRFAQRAAKRPGLPKPDDLLAGLGLRDLAGTPVNRLSGGEQQRLALAIGVAASPGVLLADEPTSQLDITNRDRVVETVRLINAQFGTTVVTVTHDPDVAGALGRTIEVSDGVADDREHRRRGRR